jgi:hypothetical protein
MEQPEYTETPVGLARQSETLQAEADRGTARAPRKAKCIQAAGTNNSNSFFTSQLKSQTIIRIRVIVWL